MGKLIYFIGILVFIELMFFIFVNAPAASLNSVVIKSISATSGGGIQNNQTGSWSTFKNALFCDVDETTITEMTSNPSNACNSNTIWGGLLIGLAVAIAIGASLLVTSTSANFTDIAWAVVGIFFFMQIGADYIGIYNYISNIHPPLTNIIAMVTILPMGIMYGFIVVEWIRGKD